MPVEPYLFFDGRCEEAIDFYKKTLGAQVNMLMRFKDAPGGAQGSCAPGNENKIMHASLGLGGTNIMTSDGRAEGKPKFEGFALSFPVKDEAEAQKTFDALSKGGQVQMPLTKTFFSPSFGMVADKFGVGWMVIVPPAMQAVEDFVISRTLDAPRELVWKAFTDPEHMKQWWGPKGFKVIHSKMDLRPGGTYHYGMKSPDGAPMWGKFTYREIKAPERMELINSFSDEAGGVTRHPLNQGWPLLMRSIFTLEELPGGKTKLTIRWAPHEATEAERKIFDDNRGSMQMGWTGTFEQLEAYLAKAQAAPKAKPAAKPRRA
jgi:uncharacterized glyoxalase superfamily protein PhnB/uncharacterized protein YndB with AHSA1/START domain